MKKLQAQREQDKKERHKRIADEREAKRLEREHRKEQKYLMFEQKKAEREQRKLEKIQKRLEQEEEKKTLGEGEENQVTPVIESVTEGEQKTSLEVTASPETEGEGSKKKKREPKEKKEKKTKEPREPKQKFVFVRKDGAPIPQPTTQVETSHDE